MQTLTINDIKYHVAHVAKQYNIKRASLFGSYANGKASSESDIDLLVEFDRDDVTLLDLAGIKIDLEKRINREVDVVQSPIPKESLLKIDAEVPIYG